MSIICESVARQILPIYRSFVARELIVQHKLNQNQAAKKLGTTQAAISQYINSKRGVKDIPNYLKIEPIVQSAAEKVAKKMLNSEFTKEEFRKSLCELCMSLREKKVF